ncbi:GntR family transcriptional regulator [Angustibacter luteus]|uniref:GntR family transcriptional regulator n=1 Tax=Angustibacter luteus TaxID=658456 RepID=A0ABW1JF60_9ACTN
MKETAVVKSETPLVESARVSLGEAAYQRLRTDIVSCRLAPGQKLTEKALAAETGFGGSPLREALTRLDHEGLVRTLPRKGYQVTPLTPKSVDDLFDLWTIVGPELVRRGIKNATHDQLEQLRRGFREVDELAHGVEEKQELRESVLNLTDEMFALFAEATKNEYLINLFMRVSGDMHRIWSTVLSAYPETLDEVESHNFPEQVFTDRDSEMAADYARRHIVAMHDRILRIFSRWPSVMSTEVAPMSGRST